MTDKLSNFINYKHKIGIVSNLISKLRVSILFFNNQLELIWLQNKILTILYN
jgi:hypothetical protein